MYPKLFYSSISLEQQLDTNERNMEISFFYFLGFFSSNLLLSHMGVIGDGWL